MKIILSLFIAACLQAQTPTPQPRTFKTAEGNTCTESGWATVTCTLMAYYPAQMNIVPNLSLVTEPAPEAITPQPVFKFRTNEVKKLDRFGINALEVYNHEHHIVLRIDKDMNLVLVDEKGDFEHLTQAERILVAALIKATKKASLTSAPLPIINKSEAKKGKQ